MSNGNRQATVLIIVNPTLKSSIQAGLDQYVADLENREGYDVMVHEIDGGSPEELKSFILDQSILVTTSRPLAGCLLVGDLPLPLYGYTEKYPLDAYYMDLHGNWGTDDSGEITSIPGQLNPTIWIGRLTASPLAGNEEDLINNYFQKNHAYRTGQMHAANRALVYVDDDWISKGDYGMGSAYADVTLVNSASVTDAEDYKQRLADSYEFTQAAVHSTAQQHNFKANLAWSESVSYTDILDLNPQSVFYCLDACRAACYTETNYIGGCYIFSGGKTLALIGETRNTTSMEAPADFYTFFGSGLCLGDAFLKWLNQAGCASYHKDRTILGDPTLKRQSEYATSIPAPPTGLRVEP